jgi:hypothetical protein
MTRPFAKPYIIFYPVVACDEMAFPINRSIRAIKGEHYDEGNPWRGDIIVAKLSGQMQFQAHFFSLTDTSMDDFAIIKNHFLTSIAPNISYVYYYNIRQ